MVDRIVIEQLLTVLPSRTRHWLACWKIEQLTEFQELWENFAAAEGVEPRRGDGGKGQRWKGGPPQSGGSQTLGLRGRARVATERASLRGPTPIPAHPHGILRSQGSQPRGMWKAGGATPEGVDPPTARFQCGQWGHWKQECPLMECDEAGESRGWEEARHAATEGDTRPKPWVLETHYEGQCWKTLVDSGSSVSMVRSSLLPANLPVLCTT